MGIRIEPSGTSPFAIRVKARNQSVQGKSKYRNRPVKRAGWSEKKEEASPQLNIGIRMKLVTHARERKVSWSEAIRSRANRTSKKMRVKRVRTSGSIRTPSLSLKSWKRVPNPSPNSIAKGSRTVSTVPILIFRKKHLVQERSRQAWSHTRTPCSSPSRYS